jgi:hypothetical protein
MIDDQEFVRRFGDALTFANKLHATQRVPHHVRHTTHPLHKTSYIHTTCSAYTPRAQFSAADNALNSSSTSMFTINGTAMQRTLRDLNRAASGCPSMTGSWSRPVAINQRRLQTEFDR